MSLSFICPRCRAHLKVRDESFVGQSLDCPECRTPLLVVRAPLGAVYCEEIVAESPATPQNTEKQKTKNRGKQSAPASSKPGVTSRQNPDKVPAPLSPRPVSSSRTPQIIAWSVATICLLALIPLLLPKSKPTSDMDESTASTVKPVDSSAINEPFKPDTKTTTTPEVKEPPLPNDPEGRLAALGKLVLDGVQQEGHFPAGTVNAGGLPVAHRWSWLAEIASQRDNPQAIAINWSQRWNDPSTDRFVRRPIPRFQNPLVENQASEDKYPASHFVGVAGVGIDAATLPVDHPRVGIFGQDRKTKPQDIRDGASNTMLLAGVEQHLGSWADGATSYRPFTREPYVHGPDGFGTGQPKSMFVLMADGSVKEINTETDPTVVRRMAAMNDGLPLDPKVPGEPSDRPTNPKPATKPPMPGSDAGTPAQAAVTEPPDKRPVAQVPAVKQASEIKIDIPAALSRKIASFDQTKPAAAYQLLLQIEELAGVRIEYDREKLGAASDRLDKPITLKMQGATLEQLLNEILRQIDLKRQDEKSRITIVLPS
jgi:hypothetical protein